MTVKLNGDGGFGFLVGFFVFLFGFFFGCLERVCEMVLKCLWLFVFIFGVLGIEIRLISF